MYFEVMSFLHLKHFKQFIFQTNELIVQITNIIFFNWINRKQWKLNMSEQKQFQNGRYSQANQWDEILQSFFFFLNCKYFFILSLNSHTSLASKNNQYFKTL